MDRTGGTRDWRLAMGLNPETIGPSAQLSHGDHSVGRPFECHSKIPTLHLCSCFMVFSSAFLLPIPGKRTQNESSAATFSIDCIVPV
jgi:hypothetical protein